MNHKEFIRKYRIYIPAASIQDEFVTDLESLIVETEIDAVDRFSEQLDTDEIVLDEFAKIQFTQSTINASDLE